jgi:hypothetical protein
MATNTQSSGSSANIPDLSRVAFFDGQRLAAADLNGAADVQRELRWLHNRSLHTWGIGLGFSVSGSKGETQVRIGAGYAIDCLGREIILTETLTKPVPARADDGQGNPVVFYLLAAYPDDSELVTLETRDGECDTSGAVRLQERASIYWKAAADGNLRTGFEIVLGQAQVKECKLFASLSVEQRRNARPSQQPYVGAGEVAGSHASWTPWRLEGAGGGDGGEGGGEGGEGGEGGDNQAGPVIGVKIEVDTSEAHFGSVPQYQAQVRGERVVTDDRLLEGEEESATCVIDGVPYLRETSRTGFTLYVHLPTKIRALSFIPVNPQVLFSKDGSLLLELVKANWSVTWIGVEG